MVHDDRQVIGHVSAVTGLNAAKYDVDVSNALPDNMGGWSGLSGAGLFCNEILIGLVEAVPKSWKGRTLWALPARRLLALADFTAMVTAHTGLAPQLESADQSALFHAPPVPHLSPSYLLSPQAEVVPFTGMEREIADLTSWCTSRRVVDVALAFGPGGVGKTRLAAELIRRMTHRRSPWTAGFLSDVQRAGGSLESLTTNIRPLLLVLDYAETRVDQVEQVLRLFRGSRHAHDPVRVLLLARTAHRWWTDLQIEWQGTAAMERGTIVPLAPAEFHPRVGSSRNFEVATRAFRERIAHLAALEGPSEAGDDSSPPQEPPRGDQASGPPEELIVSIHMAALAQVLEEAIVPTAVGAIRPVDVLMAHESRYWRHSVRSHGLDDVFFHQRDLLRQLVAVQRIVGADERRDALNAVLAAFRFHDRDFDTPQLPDREIVRRIEQMLADLYPATDGARWGAMRPDVLAAELIARADHDSDSELVVHILPDAGLSAVQQHRAMTVLARAATHQSTLTNSVARAVTAAPDVLLATAVDIATELPPSDAITWLNALKPAAAAQTNTDNHVPNDQFHRIDSLLDQLTPCPNTSGRQADTEPTSTEPEAGPLTETPKQCDAAPEAEDDVPAATERITGGHEQRSSPPTSFLPIRKAPRHGGDITLHLPPQAHPGVGGPVLSLFRLLSGAFTDPERQQRMDHALRCLGDEARRSNRPLPAVNTIVLAPDSSIELNLSTVALAIPPFQSQGPDTVWRCRGDHVLPPSTEMKPPQHAYPALAQLGWTPEGSITYVDLEHVGLVHFDGPIEHVQQILGELAFEFSTRSRASRPHVHIAGIGKPARGIRYSTQHNAFEDALDATGTHTAQARSALHALNVDHPRDARVRDPSNDLWKPRIVLTDQQMDTDTARELGRILDARPQACLGVVTRAPSPGNGRAARWTITVDPLVTNL
ncbi:hypothetical protein [Streptomyces sp. NPDC102264]|uniref:hypothetical protein n=1 Tax=Streptomyces sp. NPDC102264 TaxID=3366149 RepID=UPI003800F4F0